jgi:hypothetical protein
MLAPPQQEEDPVPACLLAQRPTPRTILLLLLLAVTLTTSNLQATNLDNAIIQVSLNSAILDSWCVPGWIESLRVNLPKQKHTKDQLTTLLL